MNTTFNRRVQGQRRDVLRQLPEALGGRPYRETGDGAIEVSEGPEKRIRLRIEPLDDRELGALKLPMQRLEFRFEGYAVSEVERLMDHFDTCTLRVGGGP